MRPPHTLAALALSAAVLACGGDDAGPPLELEDGCQPLLGGHDCVAPFPSDFYLVPDDTTATGVRIAPTGAASLVTDAGKDADIHHFFTFDGFSPVSTIVAVLPSPVAADGLALLSGPAEASTTAASPTLLIDSETGELVPHYVDLDPRADDPTRQAIVIHPLVALASRTRYVVALHGIADPEGGAATAAEGFRRLRDGRAGGDPALEPMITRYEQSIFPLIEGVGVARGDLQLAWDFTVGSHEAMVADMFAVRAATLGWLAVHTPEVTVTEVTEDLRQQSWRTVRGTLSGPKFLAVDAAGEPLVRGADGLPVVDGTTTFEFVAKVPASVRDSLEPGRALPYGHGFFGDLGELDGRKTVNLFDAARAVGFGVIWVGMSDGDLTTLLGDLTGGPGQALRFGHRVHQGIANWLVLTAAIRGPLTELPELRRPAEPGVPGVVDDGEGGTNAGDLLYDPARLDYLGISQGHILGGTMVAMNPDFRHVVLQVGGASFGHMMFRSNNFEPFLTILSNVMRDPLDQQLLIASLQLGFDRFDPATFARYLVSEPLEGTPAARRVLLQAGLGDVSVPNTGTFLHARLLDVPVVAPSPLEPFGLETVAAPVDGSALALYDFGVDLAVYDVPDPTGVGNEVHEGLRQVPAAIEQMVRFLDTGVIEQTCDGVCDPD